VIFSTHNVGEAQRYGDRVIVLDEGRVIFDGTPEALMQSAPEGAGDDFEQALVAFLSEGREL
jgi:ABC-2 type transport system ATP-binding protein